MQASARISLIPDLDDRLRLVLVHTPLLRDSAGNPREYIGGSKLEFQTQDASGDDWGWEGNISARCCARFYCLQAQHHLPLY